MPKKTFLAEVVEDILSQKKDVSNLIFVLPSKRAGTFLLHELKKQLQKTVFAPQIISIEEFVSKLSGVAPISNTRLLFEFYEVYVSLTESGKQDDFESFSKWAQILLQDFNEIDRYLIPQKEILGYMGDIENIKHWSPEGENTKMIKNYLAFWNNLYSYYQSLTDRLINNGRGYQGLIYRQATEELQHYINQNQQHHVFVGFNALNTAEQQIIQELLESDLASIYWDTDEAFVNDPMHGASLFINTYKKDWKYFKQQPFKWVKNNFSAAKNIELIGAPKNIGQAKYMGELLQNISEGENSLQNTAIVIGDENLLLPTLNALPSTIKGINITMGFPLKATPMTSLFEQLFELHKNPYKNPLYHQDIIGILSHQNIRPLFYTDQKDFGQIMINTIQEQNMIYVTLEKMQCLVPENLHIAIDLLFGDWKNKPLLALNKIEEVIIAIKNQLSEDQQANALPLEYLYRFHELFNQINTLNDEYEHISSIRTLYGIFKELIASETLDFQGEPLEGLQLMGVLESRVLDFETVIISSVNEGVFPSGKSNNSFLPFDVKLKYGLPTYKEKDAIYTYHFYRLLQRAKNVYLLYNTEPDALNGSEKSRFITQLEIERQANHTMTRKLVNVPIPKIDDRPKTIKKSPEILDRLKEIASKGFSPSSLTSYMRNPIDFYHKKVLGLREYDEVEETVAANTLGTVVHDTLEAFYKPLEGKILTAEHLNEMQSHIGSVVTAKFAETYKSGDVLSGKNLIIFNIAQQYVKNFLKQELELVKSGKQLKIIKIEADLKTDIPIAELGFPVHITGKVDRVDELDGVIRIIDYKTGSVLQGKVEIVNWEDITTDYDKYSKSFQVLAYAYMMHNENHFIRPVEAGIISFKNLKNGFLKFAKKDKPGAWANKETQITEDTFEAYLVELKKLILEICNMNVPFTEKET